MDLFIFYSTAQVFLTASLGEFGFWNSYG